MRKAESLLQKTDKGRLTGFTVGMMLCLYFAIFMAAQMYWQRLGTAARYLEDALACSNMAGAVVDLQEYGFSGQTILAAPDRVYVLFLEAIKKNLNLDDNMTARAGFFIQGEVRVERFLLYNIYEDRIMVYEKGEEEMICRQEQKGSVFAPNGEAVTHTGIYSELSYGVPGVFGKNFRAHKGKLVDVVTERR